MKRVATVIGLIFFLALVLEMLGLSILLVPLVTLLFGWALFLVHSAQEVTINAAGLATGIVALGLFVGGLHLLLRWLRAASPAEPEGARANWPLRATLAIAAVLIMMFTAGISVVGVAHQLAWMATSKEPLLGNAAYAAARRNQSGNKLKQIVIGAQNFADTHEHRLPPGATVDAQGRALHGWPTMILPYIDEQPLYNQIDRTRPWDDPVNLPHIRTVVDEFINPSVRADGADSDGFGLIHYAGNVWLLGGTEQHRLKEIVDGTHQTILVGESAGNFPRWGKPGNWRDPAEGLNRSVDGFGGPSGGVTQFGMVDGSVRAIADDIDPQVLKALSTPAGGEAINLDY